MVSGERDAPDVGFIKAQEVEVYRPGQAVDILNIHGVLAGGDVLPGFTLPVKDIFPEEQE